MFEREEEEEKKLLVYMNEKKKKKLLVYANEKRKKEKKRKKKSLYIRRRRSKRSHWYDRPVLFFAAFPAIYLWGLQWIFAHVTVSFINPTIDVVTVRLCGWRTLGVSLFMA